VGFIGQTMENLMNKALSEKIIEASLNVIFKWKKDNPNYPVLDLAQQINYSSLQLRTLGSELESEYKNSIKGRTSNKIH
jgi:hypothetical protein